jgi:hypothetical protein
MSLPRSGILAWVLLGAAAAAGAQQPAATGSVTGAREKPVPHVAFRNLDAMIDKARADLAMRLGGNPAEVTLAGWKSVQLPARVMRCEAAQGEAGEPLVAGYRIVLVYKARDYTYHSDTKSVTACPRIEAS